MAIMAGALAFILVKLDLANEQRGLIDLSWISLTGAAGARSILSTVASSMITVTGIVFSITIVTLSLASQQFGPRLLQNLCATYALDVLLPEGFNDQVRPVPALSSGYLQAVDHPGLLELAEKKDLVIRIGHRVGYFIVAGASLVEVWPGEAPNSEELAKSVNSHFITGHKRSQEQDLEFLINELVEVAARPLSPGVNDPFTAISCINHLGVFLCDLAQRISPPVLKKDGENRLRIIAYPTTFDRIVDAAFNQIRQYGRTHAAVTIRLLENIRVIISFTSLPEQREALLRQAAMIERGSHEGLPEESDRRGVHERYLAIFQTVEKCFGLTGGA